MNKFILALLVLAGVAGDATAETKQNVAAVNPPAYQLTNRGTVLDVIDSEMYTYLQVSSEAGAVWLAAYKSDIAKGDTVRYSKGVMMRNFQSKSIKRTFDKIIFVDSVMVVKE
jgi:hypothetical protein